MTLDPMTLAHPRMRALLEAVQDRGAPQPLGSAGWIVPTDVLYPTGGRVVVIIEGGAAGDRVTIHDGGGALSNLTDIGLEPAPRIMKAAVRFVRTLGLVMDGAEVRSPAISLEDIESVIRRVADGSRRLAEVVIAEARRRERFLLRDRVEAQLRRIFAEATIHQRVAIRGHSQDAHKFDFLVATRHGRLVLDAPTPDASSIAAVIVRHLDVKAANPPDLRQVIAFDEADEWPASSLDQLRLARVDLVPSHELAILRQNAH